VKKKIFVIGVVCLLLILIVTALFGKKGVMDLRRARKQLAERAEKIRTYNFPQNRVTDHRIGLTVHNLSAVLEGDLDDLFQALAIHDQAERLKALS